MIRAFDVTSHQSQRAGHAAERAKSFGELYAEQGLEFSPYRGDRSDLSFAGRLQLHWSDLDHREPTVMILCPDSVYSDRPQFGMHPWSCPNLVRELMRTRRLKLTARQLLSRNMSEAIVAKDNHAREAMKYIVMSEPEPSRKSLGRRVNERLAEMQKIDLRRRWRITARWLGRRWRKAKRRRAQAIWGEERGILSARCLAVGATGSGNLFSWLLMFRTAVHGTR